MSPFNFHFLEGKFSETKVKEMLDNYLTPDQKHNKMVAQLSLGDKWEMRGERRGKKLGKEIGKEIGIKLHARLTVLRGHFRGQQSDVLADICGLPINEVLELIANFEVVKKAWLEKKVDMSELGKTTSLSEEEVNYVISSLERIS